MAMLCAEHGELVLRLSRVEKLRDAAFQRLLLSADDADAVAAAI